MHLLLKNRDLRGNKIQTLGQHCFWPLPDLQLMSVRLYTVFTVCNINLNTIAIIFEITSNISKFSFMKQKILIMHIAN